MLIFLAGRKPSKFRMLSVLDVSLNRGPWDVLRELPTATACRCCIHLFAAAALLLAMPAESPSAPHFWPSQHQLQVKLGLQSLAIGDVNRDQLPDLVAVGNEEPGGRSAARRRGRDLGGGHVVRGGGVPPRWRSRTWTATCSPDLAVANQLSDNIAVLLGAGDGTFGLPTYFAAGAGPASLAIGDLDRDQIPDLVVANAGFSELDVSVLLGIGDGTFSPAGLHVGRESSVI